MQALKILVVGMGILIVIGLGFVAYGLTGGGAKKAEVDAAFGEVELPLATGCVIASATIGEGRLILRGDGPAERGCQQVILADPASGRILGRIMAVYGQ